MVSIGFQFKSGLRDRLAMARELADKIDEAVTKAYGKDKKYVGFAQGWGAEWLLRAIQANPERWSFWCSKGATAYPFAPRNLNEVTFPPGIVISLGADQFEPAKRYFQDVRRLGHLDQRVTFIASERDTLDGSFLDRFFQQFVGAVLSGRVAGTGSWHIYSGGENSPAEGIDPSIEFSWLPTPELVGAWRLLNREAKPPPPVEVRLETFPTQVGDQKVWPKSYVRTELRCGWFQKVKMNDAQDSRLSMHGDVSRTSILIVSLTVKKPVRKCLRVNYLKLSRIGSLLDN